MPSSSEIRRHVGRILRDGYWMREEHLLPAIRCLTGKARGAQVRSGARPQISNMSTSIRRRLIEANSCDVTVLVSTDLHSVLAGMRISCIRHGRGDRRLPERIARTDRRHREVRVCNVRSLHGCSDAGRGEDQTCFCGSDRIRPVGISGKAVVPGTVRRGGSARSATERYGCSRTATDRARNVEGLRCCRKVHACDVGAIHRNGLASRAHREARRTRRDGIATVHDTSEGVVPGSICHRVVGIRPGEHHCIVRSTRYRS